ncbi:MAG TPA: CHAT domain-containing protein [Caulobacteraceae bacterium]|nr:CHAT domain-containing protein [Caulobacteraceae bacterium]
MSRRALAALLSLAIAGLAGRTTHAADLGDFGLGVNAAKETCRAVTRFDPPKGGAAADIFCGAWENPSGRVILYPSAAAAQSALADVCPGDRTEHGGAEFSQLTQVACQRVNFGGPVRYALIARRRSAVVIGEVYPSDWAPLVTAARVLTGAIAPSAVTAAAGEAPGMSEIEAAFPNGPPGQAAMAAYELLLRRAYEYNTIWSFDTAERDFEELLRAHNRLEPDDTAGEAEIFADIALNMSNARRFDEASDAFTKASSLLTLPKDALLATKITNYRALDALNRRDYAKGLKLAIQANQARAEIARAAQSASGTAISEGDVGRVERGNADAADRRSLLISLTNAAPNADRATILSAQGDYIAAIAARALGRTDEAGYLNAATLELNQVQVPPGWLVEDVANEQADSRYVAGDFAGSAAAAEAGLKLIKTTEPGTRAEAHLWLSLEQAQTALGQTDQALASGRQAMAIFDRQTEQPGMPEDVARPHLALLEQEWRRTNDPKLAAEFFEVMSLVWDSAAARTTAQLAARMTLGPAGAEARAYQDAQRAYRAALSRQQLLSQTANVPPEKAAAAEAAVKDATQQLAAAEANVRSHAPTYLELLNPKASSDDLRAVLADHEAYLRIALGAHGGFGVLVDKSGVRPYRIALTNAQADDLADRFRRSTRLRGRLLPDFDVAASSELYAGLVAPVADVLGGARDLDVDASGSLASVPFAALIATAPDQASLDRIRAGQDYSGVDWLARHVAVSSALGPAALIRLRHAAPAPASALAATIYADYQPDPEGVAQRLAQSLDLSEGCRAQVRHALQLLGPLPETAQEASGIASDFASPRVVLGPAFTDTDFLTSPATGDADVIVLATHGVLGLSSCFTEPSLLTSLGASGDGLIAASQLLDRQLKAQLVVLSACDTAAGGKLDEAATGLGDGGDALSGLARGFIYAGARNVLATEWKVDADSSSREMAAFMAAANQSGRTLGEALAVAQQQLFSQAETGHPFYWAAFVLVGDGSRRLGPAATAVAEAHVDRAVARMTER